MGSTFSLPSISPILTQPIGPAHGCLESMRASDVAFTAEIDGSYTPSKSTVQRNNGKKKRRKRKRKKEKQK